MSNNSNSTVATMGIDIGKNSFSVNGTVTIWGAASHDPLLGQPVGRTYMETVARLLPDAQIKDSQDKPGSWYVRYNGRSTIPLKELLMRKGDSIAAMAQIVQTIQQIRIA
jgi:hypothetical protein